MKNERRGCPTVCRDMFDRIDRLFVRLSEGGGVARRGVKGLCVGDL